MPWAEGERARGGRAHLELVGLETLGDVHGAARERALEVKGQRVVQRVRQGLDQLGAGRISMRAIGVVPAQPSGLERFEKRVEDADVEGGAVGGWRPRHLLTALALHHRVQRVGQPTARRAASAGRRKAWACHGGGRAEPVPRDVGDPKKAHGRHIAELDVLEVFRKELRLLHAHLSRIWKDVEHGDGAIWKRLEGLADDVLQTGILGKWPRRRGQLRLAVQDAHAHQRHNAQEKNALLVVACVGGSDRASRRREPFLRSLLLLAPHPAGANSFFFLFLSQKMCDLP